MWSPWHRVEVCNSLRQFARGARPILKESDARRIIHRLEADIRAGYFQHLERDWRDVLRTAYEISAEHGLTSRAVRLTESTFTSLRTAGRVQKSLSCRKNG